MAGKDKEGTVGRREKSRRRWYGWETLESGQTEFEPYWDGGKEAGEDK